MVESPTVVKVGSAFSMWYSGIDRLADLPHWRGDFTGRENLDKVRVESGPFERKRERVGEWLRLCPIGALRRLAVQNVLRGTEQQHVHQCRRIGMATSPDGINWTRWATIPSWILEVGQLGCGWAFRLLRSS